MIRFTIHGLHLPNHANGSVGETRAARFARSRERKAIRGTAMLKARAALAMDRARVAAETGDRLPHNVAAWLSGPLVVTVTRVAPSDGLDEHDGLPNACKPVVDGVADAMGLPRDRSERVTWRHDQRRGPWGVEVHIAPRQVCPHCGAVRAA